MPEYDEALYSAVAKAALLELTPENTVGELTGHVDEDGAVTVTFAARMAGYPGWHWTVSVAQVEGSEPTALEVELMPGNGALLAPDWVPWSERLAEYQAAQEQLEADNAADETADDDSDDDSDEDDAEIDEDDDDLLGSDVLHGGDLDGVDIDDLDDSGDDTDDDDDPDDDDDESDDDDAEESDDESDDDESDDDESDDRTY